jgi:uncharacterized membrane protein
MAAGYGFGEVFRYETARRRKALLWWGFGLSALFVILRAINGYGDPHPWSVDSRPGFTALSFVNCEKYPPSLLFLLMTIGPILVSLVLLEKWKGRLAAFFLTFGRVPLFYYVLHIPLIHVLAVAAAAITAYPVGMMFENMPPWEWPPGYGFSLPVVYAVWVGVILLLSPACRRYADLKGRKRSGWMSYL